MTKARTPRDELQLIDRLAERSGADSAALFVAFNLGDAYYGAGKYNSKRAKISAALEAARSEDILGEVLDAIAELLGEQSAQISVESNDEMDVSLTGQKIFLSHASADRPVATLLQHSLILGGVPSAEIFYSSERSTGIPAGKDVGTYLRSSLREAGLVIELLTQTFLTRPICLMELGAAWGSDTSTFPIVVPPLTIGEASSAIGNVHFLALSTVESNQEIFSELHDRISDDVNIRPSFRQWSRAVANFDAGLKSALMASSLPIVGPTPSTYKEDLGGSVDNTDDEFTFAGIVTRGSQLIGEATNRDTVERSAILAATFYNSDGDIIGTEQTVINDVKPGRSRTFTFANVPAHARHKIEVSTLI